MRSASAALPWVVSSNRLDYNLKMVEEWVDTEEGANEFRADYINFMRVRQTKSGCAPHSLVYARTACTLG